MNRFFLALLCLCAMSTHGAHLIVNVGEFSGLADPAGRQVTLIATAPISGADGVTSAKGVSGDDGTVTFSNMVAGFWSVSIGGLPTATIRIPDSTNTTFPAFDLLASTWTEPPDPTPAPPYCPLVGYLLYGNAPTNWVVDLNIEDVSWPLDGSDVNLSRAVHRAPASQYRVQHLRFIGPGVVSWPASWSATNTVNVTGGQKLRLNLLNYGARTVASFVLE